MLERIVFAGMCIGRLVVLSFWGITPARYLARVRVPAFFPPNFIYCLHNTMKRVEIFGSV